MKQFLIFLFILQHLAGFGQTRYEWINADVLGKPYDYNNELNDYLFLHGEVKEIRQTEQSDDGGKLEMLAKFDDAGNLIYFQELSYPAGGSRINLFLEITYEYDSSNRRISECKTEILEGDTLSYRVINSPSWLGAFLFDPIETNEYGNSTIAAIDGDTTFSIYDEWGRKTMDSIPFSKNTEGAINSYWYYTDSVYCEKSWSARFNVPSEREMYLIDKYGNWIEKRLYWDNDRKYKDLFKRKIIYRE